MAKSIPFDDDNYFECNNDASASIFGYNFQAKVALWLFAKNIKDIKSIKVETKNQDIEITFNDGSVHYIQVKAQQNYSTADGSKQKMKSALESLARTIISENDKLMYVNNFKTPLLVDGDEQIRMSYIDYSHLSAEQLAKVDEAFNEIIDKLNLDTSVEITDDGTNEAKKKKARINKLKIQQ